MLSTAPSEGLVLETILLVAQFEHPQPPLIYSHINPDILF